MQRPVVLRSAVARRFALVSARMTTRAVVPARFRADRKSEVEAASPWAVPTVLLPRLEASARADRKAGAGRSPGKTAGATRWRVRERRFAAIGDVGATHAVVPPDGGVPDSLLLPAKAARACVESTSSAESNT